MSSPIEPFVSNHAEVSDAAAGERKVSFDSSVACQSDQQPNVAHKSVTQVASPNSRALSEYEQSFSHQFEVLASIPSGGPELAKQRQLLYDLLPTMESQVSKLLSQAEQNALAAGEKLVEENVEKLVNAQHRAGAAKAVSTRCGVPPDDPNFERVCRIEAQLERYMTEVIHLQKLSDTYRMEIEKWRLRADAVRSQTPELLSIFKMARRQNELFDAVRKLPYPTAGGASGSRPATEIGRRRPGTRDDSLTPLCLGEIFDRGSFRPSTAPDAVPKRSSRGWNSGSLSARASVNNSGNSPSGDLLSQQPTTSELRGTYLRKSAFDHARPQLRPESHNLDWLDERIAALSAGSDPVAKELPQSTLTLVEARKIQYEDEIRSLENELKLKRKEIQDLKEDQAKAFIKRGALEEFFLLCMSDAKKDACRRKTTAAALKSCANSRSVTPRIVAGECPADKHFSTSGSSRMYGRSFDRTRIHGIVDTLVNSDSLLAFLFEKLFPHREAFSGTKSRAATLKGDELLPALPADLF